MRRNSLAVKIGSAPRSYFLALVSLSESIFFSSRWGVDPDSDSDPDQHVPANVELTYGEGAAADSPLVWNDLLDCSVVQVGDRKTHVVVTPDQIPVFNSKILKPLLTAELGCHRIFGIG
jgi:hypothetical protein